MGRQPFLAQRALAPGRRPHQDHHLQPVPVPGKGLGRGGRVSDEGERIETQHRKGPAGFVVHHHRRQRQSKQSVARERRGKEEEGGGRGGRHPLAKFINFRASYHSCLQAGGGWMLLSARLDETQPNRQGWLAGCTSEKCSTYKMLCVFLRRGNGMGHAGHGTAPVQRTLALISRWQPVFLRQAENTQKKKKTPGLIACFVRYARASGLFHPSCYRGTDSLMNTVMRKPNKTKVTLQRTPAYAYFRCRISIACRR